MRVSAGTKSGEMRTAVNGIDCVGERENIFGVSVVVLQRDFDIHRAALALHVNRRVVKHALCRD